MVTNRPPVAALSASPAVVAGRPAGDLRRIGSSDPEGLPLRYDWDLDGNGSFETDGGATPADRARVRGHDDASTRACG